MKVKDYTPCENTGSDLIKEYGMDAFLRSAIKYLNDIVDNETYLLRLRRQLQFTLDEYRDRYSLCSCRLKQPE
jgi:hypothetical protein